MNLEQLYQWQASISEYLPMLGHWQALNLALYSIGMVLCRHSAPSRVAEKCGKVGKPDSIQRRLERFLDNRQINWGACCRAWTRWVISRYDGERLILLVDETKLGQQLSVMVVGLAYRCCCIPLVFWCYNPDERPGGQVEIIDELLSWVAECIPDGLIPLIEADRGIGTSPDLVKLVERLHWQYLFRVQAQTKVSIAGQERSLKHLVNAPGQHYSATGKVFKKAGWLNATVHVIWEVGYKEAWCLITNAPDTQAGWLYAQRFWQEASFRDLKSDGWQWHTSRIWTPDHANRLLLVMALAYAWSLTLGSAVFDAPDLAVYITKPSADDYSLFRLGLRVFDFLHDFPDLFPFFLRPALFFAYPFSFWFPFSFLPTLPNSISVGV